MIYIGEITELNATGLEIIVTIFDYVYPTGFERNPRNKLYLRRGLSKIN